MSFEFSKPSKKTVGVLTVCAIVLAGGAWFVKEVGKRLEKRKEETFENARKGFDFLTEEQGQKS